MRGAASACYDDFEASRLSVLCEINKSLWRAVR